MWIFLGRRLVLGASLASCLLAAPLRAQPEISSLAPADGALLATRTGTLTGQAPGAVLLRVDGNELTLGAGGAFSYSFDLPEGESALSIYAEDAGGLATSQVHHLEVDSLAPGIVVAAPAQTRVSSSPVTVAGTVQEPHLAGVTVRGSPASLSGNSFSASVSLVEGAQNVAIVATDSLGHSSTVTLVLTLDTTAPTIGVTESGTAFSGGLFKRPVTPIITLGDAGRYSSEILLDGSPYGSGTAIAAEGAHQLEISVTDGVGNSASRAIDFTLDFTAPTFGTISPAAGALVSTSTVSLQVEATGATSVKVGSQQGSASGNVYTIGPITLAEGSQELTIEAFDAAGNRAERQHVLIRDTTAPALVVVAPAQNAVLTASPATISGTASDPRLASVRVGGVLASLSGTSFSISKALEEGANAFEILALDTAGNSSSQTLNLTLDTTAPSFTVKVGGVALAGGEVFSSSITPTIELSEPAATVTATLDGTAFAFGAAISADGNHQLSVTVTHNSLSSSNLFSFRIDRQAPVFGTLLPAEGSVLAATSVLLEGSVTGAASLTVDGAAVTLDGGAFTAGPYTLTAGASRTFVLLARSAGGLTTERRLTVVQDGTPPQLAIQQPAEGALLGAATVAVSGTATDPHLLRVRVSGVDAQVSASSWLASGISLAEGSNTLTVIAEDRAGNQRTLTRTVVRDTTDPEIAITEPAAGTVVPAATYTIRGTASDAHLDRVEINGRRATLAGSSFSLEVALVEGANSFEAVAIDKLGRRKSATVSISRDSEAPQVLIVEPAEGFSTRAASIVVRGAYENETGTTVKVNGIHAVLTTGHFEAAAVPLAPGENRITARAVDVQGNAGVHTRIVMRDEVAPTFVRLEPAAGALALPLATVFRITFSEAMAAPAEGAITLATTAGSPIAFTTAVQGDDLVVTPQAPLPPQTTLRLTLTAALVDRAGNALSPVPAAFELTTVDTGAPGAPVLTATPAATACRASVELAGTAEADSQVKVTGGAAAAVARAGETGAFTVEVELNPEQTSVLHITATDALGNVSPELVVSLGADCTPPQVADAQLVGAVITVTFSEPVTTLSTAFRLASPSGAETFTFALAGSTATLTLAAPPAGLLELAVGEPGGSAVTDLAGNTLAFPWRRLFGAGGGDSFIAGTVFDDGRGQPLEGVIVAVTSTNGIALADPLPRVTTATDGRFLLGLPVGTHDVTFARPGYSPVFRVVTTAAGEGTHVFDPRLTLLNLPKSIGAAGGQVSADGARLEVPSGAFASSQSTSITVLSEQALPSLLPYGFSPRGAVYVNFGATLSAPGTLTLPVETSNGREVVVASLDFALLQWKALAIETVSGSTLEIEITEPGAYVVIEADPESVSLLEAVVGQVLPSLPAPEGDEIEAAEVDFSPTQVLPSQRSRATVAYTLADVGTPAPSGLPLTLGVQERLTLLDGSERRAVPYSADLLVFRAPNGDPRSRFWLQPSPLAASLPIEIGAEDVTVRTFGETTVRGNILGPDGGSVLGTDGDLLEIPAGALTRPTAVVVKRRSVGDLSHAAPAGFPVLGVIEVDLGGVQLAGAGRLTLATDDPPAAGSRGLLLGTEEIDGAPRWRALSELEPIAEGWRTVATGGSNPPWPGLRQGGLYLAIGLEGDWGLLEGELYDTDQELVSGGLISSAAVEWIQLSNANGTYVIPLPAGSAVVVSARDTRHDQVSVEIPALEDLERRVFDLEVLATGPTVVEIEPADGAANVPTTFLPEVRFSESIDRATLEEGIRLTRGGEPVAIDLDHQDDRVTIDPVASLLPDTTYTLEVGTEIADLQGRHLAAVRSVSFRTQAVEAPTPGIDAAKVLLYEPDYEGLAKIVGLPGAVPADSTVWVEAVETLTVVAEANGSFELEIPATLGDELFLTVLVPGQSAAVRLLGPWLIRGDLGAYIGPKGGKFKTAAGVEVEVQRDSFAGLTRVALQLRPAPIPTPADLQVLLDFDLDLGGQDSLKPIFIRLPAPSSPPANSTFLLSRFVEALGRRGWMAMDLLRQDGGALTNADLANVQGSLAARAAGVDASRFENPLERVLTAENMAALRQGAYLPKASRALPREGEALAPRQALEAAPQPTEGQDLGLPGLKTGGHYQVASTVVDIAWVAITRGIGDLVMFAFTGGAADFLAMTSYAGPRWLLVPVFNWLHPVELAIYDLTTGYEVYRQVQPPSPDPVVQLPPGAYSDNQPPAVVEGSPLRFALVQTSVAGAFEVLPGITATIGGDSLVVQGAAGSTGPDTEIRLFDIDTAAPPPGSTTEPKDATVRATGSGEFTVSVSGIGQRRYLLALGARIGPSERLKLRFSEVVPSVKGIELHRVAENGGVNGTATALASQPLEGGIAWQLHPVSGWRAGKYQLWITELFGDNPEAAAGEVNNTWKRKLTLELEVTRSSSIASIPLTRFANFARLGNVLAIADNDGGLRLFDASNPAEPTPLLSGPDPYRLAGGGAIRGVAIDSHGRVVIVGSGEQFAGQLHVLDPLVMDREAEEAAAWASGVWGFTSITNPLGVSHPFQKSGLPRNVATMNNDRVSRWQAGAAAPEGMTVEASPIPDADEQDLTISGGGASGHAPVSLRNLTRGRWNRVYADAAGAFAVPVRARAGDLLELRRGSGTWAYVSIDNRGIAMVDVDGSRGGTLTDTASLALVRYTGGYNLDVSTCDDTRPSVDSTPTDLDVAFGENESGAPTATLVTLVQGYGLALYQIDTANPRQLAELSTACAAVDRQALIAGMEVVGSYPIDIDGDGRIRERNEVKPEGGFAPKEIRNYVVVAHARGHVLVFDITDPAHPALKSRIKIGKPGEIVPISGVTVDRVNRRIYVGGFGNGLYSVDFDTLGPIGLLDADADQLDDRVTENIQVGSEELVDTLAFPELGVIWGGGRRTGAHSVAVGGPQLKIVAADGGPIREVSRLAPLGVPTAPEGGQPGNPSYPAAFQAQVTVGSSAPQLAVDVTSLGPSGFPIGSAGTEEFLPPVKLEGDHAVELKRQADHPWEEGSTLYLSKPVVTIADLRAIIAFQKTADENAACVRCDQVAEHLYDTQPLPADYLPELLSGHRIAVNWKEELLPGLRAVYGNLVGAASSVPSVPWAISPSLQQEPAMNPSTGMGDVAPGTLLHSGEFSHDATDLAIPGLGFDFVFTRTYRNQTLGNGPLGPGWDHNWNLSLRPLPNGEVELYDGRGRRDLVFTPFENKLPQLKPLVSFRPHHLGYVVTDKDGNSFQFDTAGRLTSITDPLKAKGDDQGSEIQLAYDAESRLVDIGSHGRKVVLSYADGKLDSVRDPANRQWRYHYDGSQRLIRVENPRADLGDGTPVAIDTTYGYAPGSSGGVAAQLEARDDLDTIVDARGVTVLDLDYETVPDSHSTRVKKQVIAGGPGSIDFVYEDRITKVKDRQEAERVYTHDAYGHLFRYRDPLSKVTFWHPVAFEVGQRNGLVAMVEMPDGGRIEYSYDEALVQSSLRKLANLKRITRHASPFTEEEGPPSDAHSACAQTRSFLPITLMEAADIHEMTNVPGSVQGPEGQSVDIRRDEAGVVQELTVSNGEIPLRVTFETDDQGLPTETNVEERGGETSRTVTTSTRFDRTGLPTRQEITVGGALYSTSYQRDDRGNVTEVTAPGNVVTRSRYNQLDWLLEECRDATGQNVCTRYHYDEAGQTVRIEKPFGAGQHVATKIEYGSRGEIEEIRSELQPGGSELVETYVYDKNLKVLEVDPPGLAKKTYVYDQGGRLESETEVLGNDEPTTTAYTYNTPGQLVSMTDGQRTSTITYDSFGRRASVQDPQQNVTYFHYDRNDNVVHQATCYGEPGDHVLLSSTHRTFGPGGQILEEVVLAKGADESGESLSTVFEYDNLSRLTSVTGPDGATRVRSYDQLGRVVRESIPEIADGVVETWYRDETRKVDKVFNVGNQLVMTSTQLNGRGMVASHTDALFQTTRFTYDDAGNRILTEQPNGSNYFSTYDGLGRPLTLTQPEGITETFTYVDQSDSAAVTYRDALGQTTVTQYGSAGELLSITYPDSTTEVREYDARGNALEIAQPSVRITQGFDANDRLISRVRTEGEGPAANESFSWDSLGRPTSATLGGHGTSWLWDTASRLRRETQGGKSVAYAPHPSGARGGIQYPSGLEVARDYNAAGNLSSVAVGPMTLATLTQKGSGLLSSQYGPLNGQFTYDPAGRLQRTEWNAASRILDETLGFDPRGLPAGRARADLGQQWSYSYDKAARLKTAEQGGAASALSGQFTYDYDAAQNLLRQQRVSACGAATTELPNDASGRNRPGSVAGDELEWDGRGRLVRKRDLRFAYDDRDRLVAVVRQTGEESTEPVAAYTYDVEGRRVAREVGSTTVRTVWDGWQAIEDYVGETIVSQRFFGSGLDQMFLIQLPQGSGALAPYFPVYDSLSNLSVLVRADGTPVERYDYDPYGGRTIVANDFQPPALEQIRLQEGEVRLQLSEPTVKNFQSSAVVLQNLSRTEQPELEVAILSLEGRQWGRQIVFRDGGDPQDDPPTWPQAGDHVRLVVAEHAFEDNFGNRSEAYTYADLVWPGEDGILIDATPPRVEEICSRGNELKLTFSEPVSATLAAQALTIDSQPVAWETENDGYTLKVALEAGSHDLVLDQGDLDLAGLGLAEYGNQVFVTDTETQPIYTAPFPGEVAASTVGNVYGFQGLPQDAETGFLYVRNRYYDPELGRFITTDPMGYADGPSQYQFALNNPVVNRDPTGEFVPCLIAGGVSVALGWGINKALKEDYDGYDAVIDFAVGSLTCGAGMMVSGAAKAGKIGKLGQAIYTIGADTTLDLGSEVARSYLHGEDITARGLLTTATVGLLGGHVAPAALGRIKWGRSNPSRAARHVDTTAGSEFLDDSLRMVDQPLTDVYADALRPDGRFSTVRSDYGIEGSIDEDGIIDFWVRAEKGRTPRGAQMFRAMFRALSSIGDIQGIRGSWGRVGGLADNFNTYKNLVAEGMDPKLAALKTFTGKMAERSGFRTVSIVKDNDFFVEVEFTK